MNTEKTEFKNGDENNPLTRYESLVAKQTSWLGYLLSWMGLFLVLITIAMGVYSYFRIESIEDKMDKIITKYENEINDLSKDVKNDLMYRSTYLENKQEKYEDRSNSNMNSAIKDMEFKFDKLSGQALLYPEVTILYNGENLEGKTIKVEVEKSIWDNKQSHIDLLELGNISIKNTGKKKLEGFNVVFTFDALIRNMGSYLDEKIMQLNSNDNNTTVRYNYGDQIINPEYNWTPVNNSFSGFYLEGEKRIINCSMDVYYYPSPKKINFRIEMIPTKQ